MPQYIIGKTFTFDAAHHLPHLPPEHKCSRPHGHTYAVTLVLDGLTLDGRGFVMDYNEMQPFRDYINTRLDHRDLNEVLDVPTTAENIAKHLYDKARKMFGACVCGVRVSETPSTFAEYSEAS